MARILIRQAHGGATRIISDPALPYFLNQGWVVIDTLDDDTDASPLYLSAAEGDLRWAKISDLGDPESAEVAVISEAVADSEALRAAFGRKAVVDVRDHGAVGDGTADDTAAIQEALDDSPTGSVIVIPDGLTFRCTGGLTSPTGKRYTITGGGELAFTSSSHLTGSGKPSGVRVLGNGTVLRGIRVTNPTELKGANTFGASTYNQGIQIEAHEVGVFECVVDRFQQGIAVEPNGEWMDIRISDNRVSNVLGRGNGPSDTTSQDGEDGGDGIVVWGARATVTGNIVSAKPGADARIGIHAEGLGSLVGTVSPYQDSMVTLSGNVVYGQFRRGIVLEDINYGSITGNTISDATWWSIAIVGGKGNVVSGNAISYTRTAADTQGSAWNPRRAPLHIRGAAVANVMADNTVVVTGVADCFLHTTQEGSGVRPQQPYIHANSFTTSDTGSCAEGILLEYTDSPAVVANQIVGFSSKGFASWQLTDYMVTGNRFKGNGSAAKGVDVPSSAGIISGNDIRGLTSTAVAIDAPNQTTGGSLINENNIVGPMAVGIELFGTSATTSVVGNRFGGTFSTAKIANAGASVTVSGNTP